MLLFIYMCTYRSRTVSITYCIVSLSNQLTRPTVAETENKLDHEEMLLIVKKIKIHKFKLV